MNYKFLMILHFKYLFILLLLIHVVFYKFLFKFLLLLLLQSNEIFLKKFKISLIDYKN